MPLKAYLAAFVVNIAGGFILRNYLAIGGITLARSLADLITFVILIAGMKRIFVELKPTKVFKDVLKMGIVALVSVAFSYVVYGCLPVGQNTILQLTRLLLSCGIACAGYIYFSMLFKMPELIVFWNMIKKKIVA
jgi:peptidoglycan biosynthesis protein MviN/MurJ (putative lipid II flippase)